MPPRTRRRSDGARSAPRRPRADERPITVLEDAARSVESSVSRGRLTVGAQERFQAIALLLRELREGLAAESLSEAQRNARLKRINALATVLARTAARDGALLGLLADDAKPLDGTTAVMREMRAAAGMEAPPEPEPAEADLFSARAERRVVPQSVISRQLANPFLAPDFSAPPPPRPQTHRLSSWELLGPLLRAFETASGGAPSSMALPAAVFCGGNGRSRTDAAPDPGGRSHGRRPPHLPARRRAGSRQDGRRRCWPRRRPTRIRCSPSCRTS